MTKKPQKPAETNRNQQKPMEQIEMQEIYATSSTKMSIYHFLKQLSDSNVRLKACKNMQHD
jgi:hypothetical protein